MIKFENFPRILGKLRYKTTMQKVEFIKMHGLGNDFVIIDKRSNNFEINDNLIQKLADRKTGAGCDQVITIGQSKDKNSDVTMKSIAEKFRINQEMLSAGISKELKKRFNNSLARKY